MSRYWFLSLTLWGLLLSVPAWIEAQQAEKQMALDWVDSNAQILEQVNRKIWSWAETGLQEFKSSRELMDLLKANGFEVQEGVAGMPTAFVASYGSGRPAIGILAEYDALPGLSQQAAPEPRERAGVTAGHGCGHSIFGTGSTEDNLRTALWIKQNYANALVFARTNDKSELALEVGAEYDINCISIRQLVEDNIPQDWLL